MGGVEALYQISAKLYHHLELVVGLHALCECDISVGMDEFYYARNKLLYLGLFIDIVYQRTVYLDKIRAVSEQIGCI